MDRTRFYYRDASAPEPTRPRTLGIVAIIERDGAVLLERRSDAPVWSLLAGGVHETESLADALRREVREETGLDVSAFAFFGTFTDPTRIVSYPDGNVYRVASVAYTVSVETFEGVRPSPESEELRLVPREELEQLETAATQQPIFECLLSNEPRPYLM